ncbi:MAG: phenylalanine--tRNA ligase subunit beta [Bdellovibrionia bacterium]
MKISLKWLNDYVDVKDYFSKPEELGELLTRAGLEVEEITNRAKDYQNVVTGLILEKGKHPNADKLSLCRVSTGPDDVHQIVCGAQNHKTGDKVIVALPGAVLPGNFAIKKAAVRGVDSGGMLCSYKELGLATESEGIAILPTEAPVGQSFAEYGGYDDVVFELKVTPNRADCLSHFGLAREVGCLLGREVKYPESKFKPSAQSTKSKIQLEVKASDLCPRYTGVYLAGVKVQPSPTWLKAKLEAVGLNSINNVVDITNFVMMELGQPLHAFDADQIKGQKIVVERAVANEVFKTLDGTDKKLSGEELTIRDSERAVCLAGVVGGQNSGVSETTKNIFLEAAYFVGMSARKTSRRHGLETDSAYRFARGVDPEGTLQALQRAAGLIAEVCGGEVFGDHHDFYPTPVKKHTISLHIQTVSDRLGYAADESKFVDYMKRLGCKVEKVAQGYSILPPSFRFDLEHEMDLVEEYARLNGYEHIPESLPALAKEPVFHDKAYLLDQKLSRVIRAEGYQQAFNFAFVGSQKEKAFIGAYKNLKAQGLECSEESIKILNPLNEEMDVMRSSLSFGLFRNMVANFHYGNHFGRLFEVGSTFEKGEGAYLEHRRVALIAWGQQQNLWLKSQAHAVVFEVKAAVESLLRQMNITAYTWAAVDKKDVPEFLHWGQFAQLVVEGKKVGYVATVHPSLLEEEKVRAPAAMAELDLSKLYQGQPRPVRVQGISKYPVVERDLALKMGRNLRIGDVLKDIKKAGGGLLTHVEVFDIYHGDKIEAGFQSVAIRMYLQDKNATLQDAQINEVQNKVLESLKKNFDISLR